MLICNNSTIERVIHIHLIYDDNSEKKCEVKKYDIGKFTFRKDDKLLEKVGTVKDIIQKFDYRIDKERKESICIILDCSEKFRSKEYIIPLFDIINVDIFPKVECIGPDKGKMSMKIISEECATERRIHTWHPLLPRKEKK